MFICQFMQAVRKNFASFSYSEIDLVLVLCLWIVREVHECGFSGR